MFCFNFTAWQFNPFGFNGRRYPIIEQITGKFSKTWKKDLKNEVNLENMTRKLPKTQNDEKMHYKIIIFWSLRSISKIHILNCIVYFARKERWHVIKIWALLKEKRIAVNSEIISLRSMKSTLIIIWLNIREMEKKTSENSQPGRHCEYRC